MEKFTKNAQKTNCGDDENMLVGGGLLAAEIAAELAPADWQKLRMAAMLEENLHLRIQLACANDSLHTVKNGLQSVNGLLGNLANTDNLNEKQLQNINGVRRQMNAVVAELVEFGREQSLKTKVTQCSLNRLVRQVVRGQQANFMLNRIALHTELAQDLPKLWLESKMIRQVLLACLDNSLAAVLAKRQPGGCVVVRTQLAAQGWVRLVVEDNGVGLTPEQQAAFFIPYFTSKPNGSGIGTTFGRAIVRQHGGEMWVSGEPETGCCVCIELPEQGGRKFDRRELYNGLARQLLNY